MEDEWVEQVNIAERFKKICPSAHETAKRQTLAQFTYSENPIDLVPHDAYSTWAMVDCDVHLRYDSIDSEEFEFWEGLTLV